MYAQHGYTRIRYIIMIYKHVVYRARTHKTYLGVVVFATIAAQQNRQRIVDLPSHLRYV